jgi:hypothetical protein
VRFIIPMLLVFALPGSPRTIPDAPFSLTIVPTFNNGDGRIEMADKGARDFYVVLTNVSNKSQMAWETWNSWGYQTISFELTASNGSKIVISKRQQDFTRNGPSTFLIPPSEHQIYAVKLDKSWEARPIVSKANETFIALKAIYEVPSTPEAGQYKVWVGHLESRSYNFVLRQW